MTDRPWENDQPFDAAATAPTPAATPAAPPATAQNPAAPFQQKVDITFGWKGLPTGKTPALPSSVEPTPAGNPITDFFTGDSTIKPGSPAAADAALQKTKPWMGDQPYTPGGMPAELTNPKLDIVTGVDHSSTVQFLRATNDPERELVLKQGVKDGRWQSWKKYPSGDYSVTINGQERTVVGFNPFGNIAADVQAHRFQYAAMLATSFFPEGRAAMRAWDAPDLAGTWPKVKYMLDRMGTGTAYNAFRAAVMGVGSAAGWTMDEVNKMVDNLWSKSPDEVKHGLITAWLWGAGPEFGFRMVGSALHSLGAGYKLFNPLEVKTLTKQSTDEGVIPMVGQASPAAKIAPFEQALTVRLIGFPAEKQNMQVMLTKIKAFLVKLGMPQAQVDEEFTKIFSQLGNKSTMYDLGAAIKARAQELLDDAVQARTRAAAGLHLDLENQMQWINEHIGDKGAGVQTAVREALIKARIKFGEEVGQMYRDAEAAGVASDYPIVIETKDLKDYARQALRELPRSESGQVVLSRDQIMSGILKRLIDKPAYITLDEAHKIRSELFNMGVYTDLTPGVEKRGLNLLASKITEAMQADGFHGANKDVLALLDKADVAWKEGIQKFKGAWVKRLNAKPYETAQLDPHAVADAIFHPDYTAEASHIKSIVDSATWDKVASAYWDSLKRVATNPDGSLNAKKFLDRVARDKTLLGIAFGPEKAAAITDFAQKSSALSGKFPADLLTKDNFTAKLQQWQKQSADLDMLMKNTYIKALTGQGKQASDAIEWMMMDPDRIKFAKSIFKENSLEWLKIRQGAMANLLSFAFKPGEAITQTVFKAGALSEALKTVGEKSLNELYGPAMTKSLTELARQIDFISAKAGHSGTGAFALAAYVLNPIEHIGGLLGIVTAGHVFANKTFVDWLSRGLSQGQFDKLDSVANWIKRLVAYPIIPSLQAQAKRTADQGADTTQSDMQQLQGTPQ